MAHCDYCATDFSTLPEWPITGHMYGIQLAVCSGSCLHNLMQAWRPTSRIQAVKRIGRYIARRILYRSWYRARSRRVQEHRIRQNSRIQAVNRILPQFTASSIVVYSQDN